MAQSNPTNNTPINDDIDILIVGSGAAASVIAAKAALNGKKVVMLEAGSERSPSDLISSQIWARKLKWNGAHVEEEGNLKIGNNFNAGSGTGGSTMHHYGVWPRMHNIDFKLKTEYNVGLDWPISYSNLAPYYDRIQDDVGLSGDHTQETWRPKGKKYPMPPIPTFAQGRVIDSGFKKLGLNTAPIPMAINTVPRKGRAACIYDGWCDAGCPIGALGNALTYYLPQALSASKKSDSGVNAQIIHNATVSEVITNKLGDKADGVMYFDNAGNKKRLMAKVVVLAAFAVQNPRILLNSANSTHPNGVANRNNLVGRYLMTHPSNTINGLFKDPTTPHLGTTGGQRICQDGYDDKADIEGAFGSYQWLIANAVKPNDLLGIANSRPDIYGAKLKPFMQTAAKHYGTMVCVAEDIPKAENRVSLSQATDQYGMPLAKTNHNVDSRTDKLIKHAVQQGLDIFKAAGATEAWAGPRFGMHMMGGTVMGRSDQDSVTNQYGQTHEVNNLFIAGPGLFPSSGAVNPTFTVHALALKSIEYLLANWAVVTQ